MPNETEAVENTATEGGAAITIQGLTFLAPHRYSEGHTLNTAEARQLQQTFKEALRNNFASTIKKALKDAGAEDAAALSEDIKTQLQSSFADYATEFQFAARSGSPRAAVDPVQREFQKIGRPILEKALAAKGMAFKDCSDDQKEALFVKLRERRPDVWELAAKRVEDTKSLVSEALDL